MLREKILQRRFHTREEAERHATKNYYPEQVEFLETVRGNWQLKIREN